MYKVRWAGLLAMDFSPRKNTKRSSEPVDEWLHDQGYFRKHSPRDPTCLFRAVSEQVYSTQHYHIRVRKECVEFMRNNSNLFQQSISIPIESYLEQMSCFTEWGGNNEIQAMSLLYQREIVVFNSQTLVKRLVTDNGFKDTINLCHTPLKQYESVFAKEFIATAAFCQSVVYQTLYKEVFKMPNVEKTVQRMLHDKTSNLRHDRFFLKGNLERREQLTTELMSKIEEGCEAREEEKPVAGGNAPFPYRVAKALDPNIYRNTDFDIWHEIRREVRNSGWTRWNGSELQVGGKCLVQVDFKDGELDEANNNSAHMNGERDGNGNTSKEAPRVVARREPAFLNGHIQEMSKDGGPVVVFIEELGEKRTLPFAALKPLATRRSRPNNWSVTTCRRHTTYESNQKWKKTWNATSRKPKESATNAAYETKNSVDGNNNSSELNDVGKTEDTEKPERWDDESSDKKKTSPLKNYTMETYNSCQGFPVKNSVDVRPITVVLDNAHPASSSHVPKHNDDYNKNPPQVDKNPGNNDNNMDRASPNVGSLPPESLIPPLQQVSLHSQSETFYPPHLGVPPIFPGNPNMPCGSPDEGPYPLPSPCFQVEPPAPGSLMDRTIRAINFSAASNFDPNNSDLPDMVTLRFFYYFGLQCFRAGYAVVYGPSGQPMVLGPNYVPQTNALPPIAPVEGPQVAMPSEDESSRTINRARQNNYAPARRRNDHPSNAAKFNNGQQQQQQQQMTKTFNNRKNDVQQEPHGPRNEPPKSLGDSNRPPSYTNARKNGPPSRYKKTIEGQNRNRNMNAPSLYKQDHHNNNHHHQQQQQPSYRNNLGGSEAPIFQVAKSSDPVQQQQQQQQQQVAPMPLMPPPPPPPLPPSQGSPGGGNSAGYAAPYGGQTIYATMPYYPSDGETFYAPGPPGFYPVPYVAHPEITDANGVNAFPGHVYQTAGENYAQPMPAVYPPYIYPQQAIYPGLPPPQIGQENWFPVPGPPQFMQYPQCPPSQSPPNINGSAST